MFARMLQLATDPVVCMLLYQAHRVACGPFGRARVVMNSIHSWYKL